MEFQLKMVLHRHSRPRRAHTRLHDLETSQNRHVKQRRSASGSMKNLLYLALVTAFWWIQTGCVTQKPVASEEPLKPGEIVHIHFSKAFSHEEDSSQDFVRTVGNDGLISLNFVTIPVAGLTPPEASIKIQHSFETYAPLKAELRRIRPNAGVYAENEAQTKFGIFLTLNSNLDTRPGMVDLAHVQLVSPPVISAKDLISYDLPTHSMKLRREALTRIPRPPVSGLPFVVVADGKRIYLGAFWTEVSSMSSDVPTITVNKPLLDTSASSNVLLISRAYPASSFGKGPDPRGDPRIKSALEKLHKLE